MENAAYCSVVHSSYTAVLLLVMTPFLLSHMYQLQLLTHFSLWILRKKQVYIVNHSCKCEILMTFGIKPCTYTCAVSSEKYTCKQSSPCTCKKFDAPVIKY